MRTYQQFTEAAGTTLYHVANAEYRVGEKVIAARVLSRASGKGYVNAMMTEDFLEAMRRQTNPSAPHRMKCSYAWGTVTAAKRWFKENWADWSPSVVHIFTVSAGEWWKGDMSLTDDVHQTFDTERENSPTAAQRKVLLAEREDAATRYWKGERGLGVWEYLCPRGFTITGRVGK